MLGLLLSGCTDPVDGGASQADKWEQCAGFWNTAAFPWKTGSQPTPFSPLSLTGLAAWTKADAGTWQNSTLTTPATADGDPIGGWVQQGGTAVNWLQASAGSRPKLKLAIQNSRPVIRFGVENGFLTLSSGISGVGDFSLYWAGSLAANGFTIFGDNVVSFWIVNILANQKFQLRANPGGTLLSAPYAQALNQFCVYEVHRTGSVFSFYRDGLPMTDGAASTSGSAITLAGIGCYNGSSDTLRADMGEVIFQTTRSTATEQYNCSQYLKAGWGTR